MTQKNRDPFQKIPDIPKEINKMIDNHQTHKMMPEQFEVLKRKEKFERQQLKTEHIMSKSFHNKQYITVEGKNLLIIDHQQPTIYCNPRDLAIQKSIEGKTQRSHTNTNLSPKQ